MQRREFLTVTGAVLVQRRTGGRAVRRSTDSETALQEPALSPEVFSRRLARARR